MYSERVHLKQLYPPKECASNNYTPKIWYIPSLETMMCLFEDVWKSFNAQKC